MANPLSGAGLGLRREMLSGDFQLSLTDIDFLEVAPENWMFLGGRFAKQFQALAEQIPITLHGLSLNIGGFTPIDVDLVNNVKQFIQRYNCPFYSDHLTFCADQGHLYDLMPIPFTEEAVTAVAARIRQVQDILERRIAIENASYYAAPFQAMSEIDFINAVVTEADCDLLLDVNNIYVNSVNHGYDAAQFLQALPGERASYIHIAGHYDEAKDLKVDTHGADVINPVWQLLDLAYQHFDCLPTLLERDFNIPPMERLNKEILRIKQAQSRCSKHA